MQQDIKHASSMQDPQFRYDCFISYRRSDGTRIARWLRRRLLSYRLPRSFRERRSRPLSVYLDTDYERATEDYFVSNIAPALNESRFLIVVGTPDANKTIEDGKPNWVEREIAYFTNTPQRNNILAVRAAGDWDDPFPGNLRQRFPYLHIVDLRGVFKWSFRRLFDWVITPPEIAALVAPLYEITQEEMPAFRQEEARRSHARLLSSVAAAAVALIVVCSLGAYGLYQRSNADTAQQIVKAENLAAQSGVIASQPQLLQQALLLAIEGYRRATTLFTSNALQERFKTTPIVDAQFRHDEAARVVRFSPDGKLLASGGDDGKLRIWDIEGRTQVAELPQDRPVRNIIFGPRPDEITAFFRKMNFTPGQANDKGRLLTWLWKENRVSAQYEATQTVHDHDIALSLGHAVAVSYKGIWHPARGEVVSLERGAPDSTTWNALTPDSRFVAVVSKKSAKSVDISDVATGKLVQSFPVEGEPTTSKLSFDLTGKRLLLGRNDGKTNVFDLELGRKTADHQGDADADAGPVAFAFSPDNKYVAEVDGNRTSSSLKVWQLDDGVDIKSPSDQSRSPELFKIFSAAFSPDSRFLAICLSDMSVRVFRFDEDDASRRVFQFTSEAMIMDIAFHPTRPLLATADQNGAVTLWRLDRGRGVAEFNVGGRIEMSEADGKVALLGGKLRVVGADLKSTQYELDTENVVVARFSGSGNLLALGRDDGSIAVMNFSANRTPSWFDRGHRPPVPAKDPNDADPELRVSSMAFSADEKQLILAGADGVSTLDLATMTETVRIKESVGGGDAEFSRDGALLAITGKPTRIFSTRTFDAPWIIPTVASDTSVAFSPDGKYVAGRLKREGDPRKSRDNMIVWDIASHQPVITAPVDARTSDAVFNKTSQFFAFSDGKKIQVWDLQSKKRLDGNQETAKVESIAFHPTEPYLASEHRDKKVRVWKFLPESQIVTEIPQDETSGQLDFTPDGRFIVHIDGKDDTPFGRIASFSPWKPADVLRIACAHAIKKGLGKAVWNDYLRDEPYRETCALP